MQTYVIETADKCWYVGRTTRPLHKRLREHWGGCKRGGAKWLDIHAPYRLLEVRGGDVEKETTIEYMLRYGRDRVRGGPWVRC